MTDDARADDEGRRSDEGRRPDEGRRSDDQVGSLAEEAAKLFAAAADWAREHTGDQAGSSAAASGTAGPRLGEWLSREHIATGAPECRWCPLCQAIGLLRSTSPEVKEHLASLVVVARQLLDAVADSVVETATDDGSRERRRSRTPDVEHIDLAEGDSWD
jgi:hypothetical protein